MLGQCRVKFDFKQTLSRHQPNISIVFTISGFCHVHLTCHKTLVLGEYTHYEGQILQMSLKQDWFNYLPDPMQCKCRDCLKCSSDNTQNWPTCDATNILVNVV